MSKRELLFVCYYLHERPAKIASMLNIIGVKPTLITVSSYSNDNWNQFFKDHLIVEHEKIIETIANFVSPIVHQFSKAPDSVTYLLLKNSVQFVYDYKDVFPGAVKGFDESDDLKVQQALLDAMVSRSIPISYKDGQLDRFLAYRGITTYSSGFYLPDTVWPNSLILDDFPRIGVVEKASKVVFIGNWSIEKLEPDHAGHGILPVIEEILKQGLSFDLFPFRHDFADTDPSKMEDYIRLAETNKNFRIRERVSSEQLPKYLQASGWGSLLSARYHFPSLSNLTYIFDPQSGMPGRVSDYLGAGLPLIVDKNSIEQSAWCELYNIGLSIPKGDLFKLKRIMEQADYGRLSRAVERFVKAKLNPKSWATVLASRYWN